jgi:hypothetical protein
MVFQGSHRRTAIKHPGTGTLRASNAILRIPTANLCCSCRCLEHLDSRSVRVHSGRRDGSSHLASLLGGHSWVKRTEDRHIDRTSERHSRLQPDSQLLIPANATDPGMGPEGRRFERAGNGERLLAVPVARDGERHEKA